MPLAIDKAAPIDYPYGNKRSFIAETAKDRKEAEMGFDPLKVVIELNQFQLIVAMPIMIFIFCLMVYGMCQLASRYFSLHKKFTAISAKLAKVEEENMVLRRQLRSKQEETPAQEE